MLDSDTHALVVPALHYLQAMHFVFVLIEDSSDLNNKSQRNDWDLVFLPPGIFLWQAEISPALVVVANSQTIERKQYRR